MAKRNSTESIGRCTNLGRLEGFVESLDEGSAVRSVHVLAGQMHRAARNDRDCREWVAAVRRRFDAVGAASFEAELAPGNHIKALADPPAWAGHAEAVAAMTRALAGAPVGHAVTYCCTAADAGGLDVAAACVRVGDSRAMGIVLARAGKGVGSSEAVQQYLAALCWHMQCADQALRSVAAAPGGLTPLDMVNLLPTPCLVTDTAGRSIERNEAFTGFMMDTSMHLSMGRVVFADHYLQDSWQVALNEVHITVVRQSLLATGQDGRQWRVHMVPFRWALGHGDALGQSLILVTVEPLSTGAEPDFESVLPDAARPLTPAETEVLNALLQGHTAKVIANSRGASVNTVRNQIMTILGKTGHHNQKSLMASFSPSTFRSSFFASPPAGMSLRKR
jgi:DNA-binding CsgD family transcriptional regulator